MWNAETNNNDPEIRAELVITGDAAKQDYAALEKQKDEIEKAIKLPLQWHNPEARTACRIYPRTYLKFV